GLGRKREGAWTDHGALRADRSEMHEIAAALKALCRGVLRAMPAACSHARERDRMVGGGLGRSARGRLVLQDLGGLARQLFDAGDETRQFVLDRVFILARH